MLMVYLETSLTESIDFSPSLRPVQMVGNREIAISFLEGPSETSPT